MFRQSLRLILTFLLVALLYSAAHEPVAQVKLKKRATSSQQSVTYVRTPVERYCTDDPNLDEEHYKDEAFGRGNAARNPSQFFQSQVLWVDIFADKQECTDNCKSTLDQEILSAFVLWRSLC